MDNLAELLRDAQLIANFGRDAARIRDDRLFKAIRDVSAAQDSREAVWGSNNIVELQVAMVEGLEKIHPVTLSDLKSGWKPFGPSPTFWEELRSSRISLVLNRVGSALGQFFFVGIAIMAILVALHYTQWQKRAEAVIIAFESGIGSAEVTTLQNAFDTFLADKTYAALDEIVNDTNFIEVLREASKRSYAHYLAKVEYNNLIQEYYQIHKLLMYDAVLARNKRIENFNNALREARISGKPVSVPADEKPWVEIIFPKVFNNIRIKIPASNASAWSDSGSIRPPPTTTVVEACAGANLPFYADSGQDDGPTSVDGQTLESRKRFEEASGLQFIGCLAGVGYLPPLPNYDDKELRQKIESISLWLLPAVFGIFGAVVYHLRVCMDRLRRDPRFSRAVMRIVLGALGGIAFGWFWSPSAAASLLPPTLPLGAYAVAFLVGYSIDVFFALLDRIVFSVSRSISRIGTSEEGKT